MREAVGPDIQIMIDLGITPPGHNSLLHLIRLARLLEPYDISWLEEPLNFDELDAHAQLARATTIPLAAGERIYNRWHFKQLMDSGAIAIVQPDPITAMGITNNSITGWHGGMYLNPSVGHVINGNTIYDNVYVGRAVLEQRTGPM